MSKLISQIESLQTELIRANERFDEASKRHDTIVMTMTQERQEIQRQLEDQRKKRKWWQWQPQGT